MKEVAFEVASDASEYRHIKLLKNSSLIDYINSVAKLLRRLKIVG
jgi:hypothetical protein